VLVGDDFSFGARRAGNYAMLDAAGSAHGFDVARMLSYEVHGLRVSSSAVRDALAAGDMPRAQALLGRPYSISGHVVHGRKLGRDLGFRTLNLRFGHPRPATHGHLCRGCTAWPAQALPGVASLGVRPTVEDGRPRAAGGALPAMAFDAGPDGGYGRCVQVDLLHKLHDEQRYDSLTELQAAIAQDMDMATSGLMVLARGPESQRRLNRAFAERQVHKTYHALVQGCVADEQGTISAPLICDWPNRPRQIVDTQRGKPALTHWRVLQRLARHTRLALEPVTGRSHQLRVHLQSIGHPICGDTLYNPDAAACARLTLHAAELRFVHPDTGQPCHFTSPVPF
jgi:hypothetical protein